MIALLWLVPAILASLFADQFISKQLCGGCVASGVHPEAPAISDRPLSQANGTAGGSIGSARWLERFWLLRLIGCPVGSGGGLPSPKVIISTTISAIFISGCNGENHEGPFRRKSERDLGARPEGYGRRKSWLIAAVVHDRARYCY
jgi:hypothetical protein